MVASRWPRLNSGSQKGSQPILVSQWDTRGLTEGMTWWVGWYGPRGPWLRTFGPTRLARCMTTCKPIVMTQARPVMLKLPCSALRCYPSKVYRVIYETESWSLLPKRQLKVANQWKNIKIVSNRLTDLVGLTPRNFQDTLQLLKAGILLMVGFPVSDKLRLSSKASNT